MPISSFRSPFSVYQTALAALRAGISFVPIVADGSKRPLVRWKVYQHRMPTPREARFWFVGKNHGIAFVTGTISGGLEVIDFDARDVYESFVARVHREGYSALLERIEHGYKENSPQGVHLYYRCAVTEGSKKLAQRPLPISPWRECTIETRGEGGYCIGAPSSGTTHPSGSPYQLLCGNLATIQRINPEERALLFSLARTCDEIPVPEKGSGGRYQSHHGKHGVRRPGTIFNERATWPEILEPHGWTQVMRIGNETFWRRPGKDVGMSATTNYEGSDYLYVFSTSTIFEPRIGMSKFAAYTFLEHQGDFSAARKALEMQGYGEDDPSVSGN